MFSLLADSQLRHLSRVPQRRVNSDDVGQPARLSPDVNEISHTTRFKNASGTTQPQKEKKESPKERRLNRKRHSITRSRVSFSNDGEAISENSSGTPRTPPSREPKKRGTQKRKKNNKRLSGKKNEGMNVNYR